MKRFSKSPTPGRSLTGCVESQSVSSAYYSIDYCREQPCFLPCWRMFELDLGQVYVSVPRLGKNWIDRLQVSSFLEPRGGRADPDTKPIQLGSELRVQNLGRGITRKFKPLSWLLDRCRTQSLHRCYDRHFSLVRIRPRFAIAGIASVLCNKNSPFFGNPQF